MSTSFSFRKRIRYSEPLKASFVYALNLRFHLQRYDCLTTCQTRTFWIKQGPLPCLRMPSSTQTYFGWMKVIAEVEFYFRSSGIWQGPKERKRNPPLRHQSETGCQEYGEGSWQCSFLLSTQVCLWQDCCSSPTTNLHVKVQAHVSRSQTPTGRHAAPRSWLDRPWEPSAQFRLWLLSWGPYWAKYRAEQSQPPLRSSR